MKWLPSLILLIILCSCKQQQAQEKLVISTLDSIPFDSTLMDLPKLDTLALGLNFTPSKSYVLLLEQIKQDRSQFQQRSNDSLLKDYFEDTLLNKIVPHWYGTTWAFEGHTNTPNNGEIACGYFVSTTLKHFGFHLNRYKLAQQHGFSIAKSLQPETKLPTFRDIDIEALNATLLKEYREGIYFVGLDNHVGYVVIRNGAAYFLHSSYCDNEVVIEPILESDCFLSNIYVFAELSTSPYFLKKWLNKTVIPVNIQ